MVKKKKLSILSYNIHKGFSFNNREFVLKKMREAIVDAQADLVFLQEVHGLHRKYQRKYSKDWTREAQFEILADQIWPHFAYGKNAVYEEGHHGNAILSKYPISFWENIDVSMNRLERRGLLHAAIEVPGLPTPVHAICVHLGLFEADRQRQIHLLCDRIESHVPHQEPLIIGGDFNDWRLKATPTLQSRLEIREAFHSLHGDYARTFPTFLPALRLDRLYCRGSEILKAESLDGPPWTDLSDHLALRIEIAI